LDSSQEEDRPIVRIGPGQGAILSRLREVWSSRELLLFLAWRDVTVRYKQTALGVGWAVLQPILATGVLTLVFGFLARVPSDSVPYPVFAFCGLLPWQLCASAFTGAANSLVSNERLLTKVYFPRLILPVAAALAALVDFAFAFPVFLVLMAWYGLTPAAGLWLLPVFVLLTLLTALAFGIGLAAVNIRYRDVRHALPFLTQIWMLATPIVYPASLVPARWRPWLGLNPLAGVVEGFRWSVLGQGSPPLALIVVSTTVALVFLIIGVAYFAHAERSFADVV
jgi:lipopolysaccharide transport system permease protein